MNRVQSPSLHSSVLLGLLLTGGCSSGPRADYSQLELIDVTGRVTLDDVPLEDALVEFESTDLTASSARTDHNGEYRLMFDSNRSGCLPGEKVVRISMRASGDEEDPDAEVTGGRVIPDRYNTASQLRAAVSADSRRFDFDLSSSE